MVHVKDAAIADGTNECFVERWIETAQSILLAFPLRALYCFQLSNFPVAALGYLNEN